jgi:phage gpG-like protein
LGSDLPYSGIHNWGGIINKKARIAVVTHKVFKKGIKKGKTLFAKNDKNATYSQKAKVGAYQINMPQRQFIGNTRRMRLRLYKAAKEEYKKIMR